MKTKNKLIACVEIAIVLCSLFLVAIPAIAAEQNQEMQKISANAITTASEDDYVLSVYGNANEDDTIDMRDLTYVKLIFFGKKPETELADAKYDGKINPLDFIQIKLIIVGKEKELTIVDSADRIVTVKKPIERIVAGGGWVPPIALRILGVTDKVVGVTTAITKTNYGKVFFPELQDLPTIGGKVVDYEVVLSLNPDVLIAYAFQSSAKYEEKLPGVTVLYFDFTKYQHTFEVMGTLGYVLDRQEDAQEYMDFCEMIRNNVEERVETIPEEERITVYLESVLPYQTYTTGPGYLIEVAGGRNIAADIVPGSTGWLFVDPEWVIEENPKIIIKMVGWGINDISAGYETDDPSDMKNVRDEIMSRAELAKVAAVQNEAVYVIANDVCTVTPDSIISLAYYTKWFYPELCEDLDPQAIHQEYIDTFHESLNWNVYERGVFVYPPLEDS